MADGTESVYAALRAFLEARRDLICVELGEHPRPVAACDVHFNRLLEERTAVCRELDRLQALRDGRVPRTRMDDLLRSSPCLDEAARRRFLSLLARCETGRR